MFWKGLSASSTVIYLDRAGFTWLPGFRSSKGLEASSFHFTARLKIAFATLVRLATVARERFRGPFLSRTRPSFAMCACQPSASAGVMVSMRRAAPKKLISESGRGGDHGRGHRAALLLVGVRLRDDRVGDVELGRGRGPRCSR
jgi:hypothetical protein